MNFINRIEIFYFRSINRQIVKDIRDYNIFTGKNDVGKSNLLKALNLFFNHRSENHLVFDFAEEFNIHRASVVSKDSIKGKSFIQVKVTFNRGSAFPNTLPEQFTVTKNWYLYSDGTPSSVVDDIKNRLERKGLNYSDRSKSSLTQFLNRIKYFYIPAIKDESVFRNVIGKLSDTILSKNLSTTDELSTALRTIEGQILSVSSELNDEYKKATNVESKIGVPQDLSSYFKALKINTQYAGNAISLDKRGDGFRVRYIPSTLHYIAKNSKNYIIWGFEEPENSLEYSLAEKMAYDFQNIYSQRSQIFITSHSPAFLKTEEMFSTKMYRCFNDNNMTKIIAMSDAQAEESLEVELGYINLQKQLFIEYSKKMEALASKIQNVEKLKSDLDKYKKPVLYTEGKTDVTILEKAWNILYEKACPFIIKSCNTMPDTSENTTAGCDMLKTFLNSARHDSHLVIGLFDRDEAGISSYNKLNRCYVETSKNTIKKHENSKCFAILLPTPSGKEDFAEAENLEIEYYFDKEYLDIKIEGKGLILSPKMIEEKCGKQVISRKEATELSRHNIDSRTKAYFAETIVPTLPKAAFSNFSSLFNYIEEILKTITDE